MSLFYDKPETLCFVQYKTVEDYFTILGHVILLQLDKVFVLDRMTVGMAEVGPLCRLPPIRNQNPSVKLQSSGQHA